MRTQTYPQRHVPTYTNILKTFTRTLTHTPFNTYTHLHRHTTSYTILDYISGKGHHGFHKGHSLFNETAGSRMFIAVLPEEKLDNIFAGLKILLEDKEVVLFISDVSVIREEYFHSQKV